MEPLIDWNLPFKPAHLSTDYLFLKDNLDKMGITNHIAGGYARDIFFSKTPRDLDIALTDFQSEGEIEAALDMIVRFLNARDSLDRVYSESSHPNYSFKGIYAVIKTKFVTDMDLIFWKPGWSLQRVLLAGFDYNMNQFYFPDGAEQPVFAGDTEAAGVLMPLPGAEITYGRKERMEERAKLIGWEVPGYRTVELIQKISRRASYAFTTKY